MESDIEVGQVLTLKIRFNNNGLVAASPHPYLVVALDDELGTVEIAQIDSLQGKEWKAFKWGNKVVYATNPKETVIDKDSYVQLDNTIKIQDFKQLNEFRRQTDKLSGQKLHDVLMAYRTYHEKHEIDDSKNVYMDEGEVLSLNS